MGTKARGLSPDEQAVLWHFTRVVPKADRLSARRAGDLFGRTDRAIRGYLNGRQGQTEAAYRAAVDAGRLGELVLRYSQGMETRPAALAEPPPAPVVLPSVGQTVADALDAAVESVRQGVNPVTALIQAGVLRGVAEDWWNQPDMTDGHARLYQAEADALAQLERKVHQGGVDARIALDVLERRAPRQWRPRTEVDLLHRSEMAGLSADEVRAAHAQIHGANEEVGGGGR